MPVKNDVRRAVVVGLAAIIAACGISAVGEFVTGDGASDGGTEGGPPVLPDASDFDGGGGGDASGDGGVDASFDAQGKCLEVCEAGTCDAGTCVIDCATAG